MVELQDFGVDPERGFLPASDPLRSLTDVGWEWEAVAAEMPKLLAAGAARRATLNLPVVDAAGLQGEPELRRAMLLLSYFGHAYVWGERTPADSLPASVAVPWHAVAKALGRPPVLSYASYALDNWRRLDPDGPIALGNIVLLQNFLGGMDEEWFVLVHVDIEQRAAVAIRAIFAAAAAAAISDDHSLTAALAFVAGALSGMHATLARMPERCDPYVYFHRVRPYIHGWKDNPALPGGLTYEGVEEYGAAPQRFRGETGAQSAIVPALDAALDISHAEDPLRIYLNEMREYMPPGHRRFIAHLEATSHIRQAAESGGPELRTNYNRCVRTLAEFRDLHREFAGRYIARQHAADQASNPHDVGTGGTPFMPYLGKHRDETVGHILPDGNSEQA